MRIVGINAWNFVEIFVSFILINQLVHFVTIICVINKQFNLMYENEVNFEYVLLVLRQKIIATY